MTHNAQDISDHIPWKRYATTLAEVWLAFSLATFCLGLYLSYLENNTWIIIFTILMVLLYLFIIIICIKRLINYLSIPALMLMVPPRPPRRPTTSSSTNPNHPDLTLPITTITFPLPLPI